MNASDFDLYKKKALVLKAMGHPSRLLMLEELASGEKCVCHFVDLIGDDWSTISKHLKVMREARIVELEKRGQKVFYRLRVPCVIRFIDCIEAVVKDSAELEKTCSL